MLVEQAIDRLRNLPATIDVDWLDVQWQQCLRRAFRSRTRNGRDVRVLLRLRQSLWHEDVLWLSPDRSSCIAQNVLPAEMLVASSLDATTAARLAYEIGNLHVPMEIRDQQIIAPADGPIAEAFERAEVPFVSQMRRFQPNCRSLIEVAVAAEMQIIRRSPENA